jgi:hypothetical protein
MRWISASVACFALTALVLGCAPAPPPGTMVKVTDVKSLAGTWQGTLIDAADMGTPLRIVINPDATYSARFGDTSASGTIVLQPDGQLAFTMTSAAGLLGLAESSSMARLYARGGRRVLVGNGRVGWREQPFSWNVTEQQ